MRIAIVGAGMAGLACAEALVVAGCDVALFDKGRGAGGRMSTRRIATARGEVAFDHGAQYMTARDPAFRTALEDWRAAGLVEPWPAAGEHAWVGAPTMNAPLKAMSAGLTVRWETRIEGLAQEAGGWRIGGEGLDEGGFSAVVCAMPAEQAALLLRDAAPALAQRAATTPSEPCWTAMAAFDERLAIDADVLRGDGATAWAARNSAKPGRSGPESWVVQASPDWSRRNLERVAPEVAQEMLQALFDAAGLALIAPLVLQAHRWRYARSGAAGVEALWDASAGVGACGDWLLGPRVQSAWLSGRSLAAAITGTSR